MISSLEREINSSINRNGLLCGSRVSTSFICKSDNALFFPVFTRHLASEHFHGFPVLKGQIACPSVFPTKNDVAYFFPFQRDFSQQFSRGREHRDGTLAVPAHVQVSIPVALHSVHAKIIEF